MRANNGGQLVKSICTSTTNTTAAAPNPKRGGRPRGNWDVSGRYSLRCTSRYQPIDASEYSLELYYEHDSPHTCILFGLFEFANLGLHGGVMRLCPRSDSQRLYTDNFDAACVLAKDVRPCSKSKEWLMRWRAEHYDFSEPTTKMMEVVGGCERAQSQFLFRRDPATGLIHITFPIVHRGKHLLYEGTQLLAAEQHRPSSSSHGPMDNLAAMARALTEWSRLFDPDWENRPVSDTDLDDEMIGSGHNHWERPRTGAMIYARNKPGPNPGFRVNEDASSKLIEERPAWAWDVTGRYLVTSPDFDSIVNGPRTSAHNVANDVRHESLENKGQDQQQQSTCSSRPDFQMTIWLENNRWHSKVGRQLWIEFTFGESRGTMRLCPGTVAANLENADKQSDVQSFEEACVLEPGVWPGVAPPKAATGSVGVVEWGMRWRGYNPVCSLLWRT